MPKTIERSLESLRNANAFPKIPKKYGTPLQCFYEHIQCRCSRLDTNLLAVAFEMMQLGLFTVTGGYTDPHGSHRLAGYTTGRTGNAGDGNSCIAGKAVPYPGCHFAGRLAAYRTEFVEG